MSLKKDSNPWGDNTKITITFDSEGGLEVNKITFKKGTKVELPETVKEGFLFSGWFFGDNIFKSEDTPKLEEDIKLRARWEEIKADEKVMTINFDAQGGKISGNNSKISQSVVKCTDNAYTVESLPTATKDGYTFMSWVDKNGTPILNGALLTCEDTLNLYANYQKKGEQQKTAKCPDGYAMNQEGTKCATTGTVHEKCPSYTKVDGDLCINTSDNNAGTRQCKEYTVSTDGKGHTWTGKGDYYMVGNSYGKCAYYKWSSYTTKSACDSAYDIYHRTVWVSELNGCYAETVMNNYETVCASDYQYYSSSDLSSKFGLYDNGKCLKKVAKEKYCDDGYTYTDNSCMKFADPIYE